MFRAGFPDDLTIRNAKYMLGIKAAIPPKALDKPFCHPPAKAKPAAIIRIIRS